MSFIPIPIITFSDHYWFVGGDTTKVWSSARVRYVEPTDAAYLAWMVGGRVASNIATSGELFELLIAQWVPLVFSQGVAVTSTGMPSLKGTYALSDRAISQITTIATGIAAGKPLPGGGSTFNYPDISNTMHEFTETNFLNFGISIEGYVYNFEQALSTLLNGGAANLPSSSLTIA